MRTAIVAIAAIAVIAIIGYVDLGRNNTNAHSSSSQPSTFSQNRSTVATNTVTIQNFAFNPASITIKKGTTVTWTNKDSTTHTVTPDAGLNPASDTLQPGQTYSFKFTTTGTFTYHCSIHPGMAGSITVTE